MASPVPRGAIWGTDGRSRQPLLVSVSRIRIEVNVDADGAQRSVATGWGSNLHVIIGIWMQNHASQTSFFHVLVYVVILAFFFSAFVDGTLRFSSDLDRTVLFLPSRRKFVVSGPSSPSAYQGNGYSLFVGAVGVTIRDCLDWTA